MALALCSNCRLPVNGTMSRCPQCAVLSTTAAVTRSVPVALVALFATVAVIARRRSLA